MHIYFSLPITNPVITFFFSLLSQP
jgi:hypothetical protein